MALADGGRPGGRESARILVVDDEPIVRELLARWLRAAGYDCAAAADGQAAWEHFQQHEVHLATLDITMPGLTGLELLERIRPRFPETEILMLTAIGEAGTAIEALTHGASGYLIKPVQREELLFHVRRGLEHRQLLLERKRYTERLEVTVLEQTLAIRTAHEETIHRLMTASMYRDEETGAHIRRTGLLSEALARAAGWPAGEAALLRMAAPMHDVGKIGIPDAILRKPGRLTPEEFNVMKTHTLIGARMLAGSESPVLQMAEEIALSHHERWDGGGYPHGRAARDIPETGRIVAIVDVYDALSHDRVYRPGFPEGEVHRMLRDGRGSHFDPELLDGFLGIWSELRDIAAEHPDADAPDAGAPDAGELLELILSDVGRPEPVRARDPAHR